MAAARKKQRSTPEPAQVSIVPAPVPIAPAPEPVAPPAQVHFGPNVRLFEWMTSGMMIGVAIILAINPKSIQFGGFYLIENVGLTAPVLSIVFLIVGIGRIAALYANGRIPKHGPIMRSVGAIVGVCIWVQMLYALTLWSMKGGYLSIGVSVYLFLAIGEGVSCYRAAADGRCNSPR